jgi:hypothetical protein
MTITDTGDYRKKRPAYNKRFGEIGVEDITRNFAAPFDHW